MKAARTKFVISNYVIITVMVLISNSFCQAMVEINVAPATNPYNKLMVLLSLERARAILSTAQHILTLQNNQYSPLASGEDNATHSLGKLLSKSNKAASVSAVPQELSDHINIAVVLARKSPELGLARAASLCDEWGDHEKSEYIFSRIIKLCEEMSKGRNLEMTVIMFRSFLQNLKSEELRHRAQWEIGRLYYENGEFGKALLELDIDRNVTEPSRSYTLSGLVRAMALLRLGRSDEALLLLEWVAANTPDVQQQAKAAFWIGRINLLYNRYNAAQKWLNKVAYELMDTTHREQAKEILSKIPETSEWE